MNENKQYYIYKHTNIINNKVYIGQTCQIPQYRCGKNGNGYKGNLRFWSAIQSYGGKQKTAGVHPITKEKLKWEYVDKEN